MVDITQFIIISVVVSLTVILIIIGAHTIAILKEFRTTVSKINKILDDSGKISESVAKPVSAASDFLLGIRGVSLFTGLVKILKKHKRTVKEED